jgi:glutaredoxin-like protein
MMGLLNEADRKTVQGRLEEMARPVRIVYFTQELECQFCRETGQLLAEVVSLSSRIHLETYDLQVDREKAAQYGVDKVPGTVVEGDQDYGIRFYGMPSGYEFVSLLETIVAVSRADSGLQPAIREILAQLQNPVRLQVFVTPT